MSDIIRPKFIDLVVGGPDFSGTSTQIDKDIIPYLQSKNMIVRDIRGNEFDALFHSEKFSKLNQNYLSLRQFLEDTNLSMLRDDTFSSKAWFVIKETMSEFLNRDMSKNTKNRLIRQMYDALEGVGYKNDLRIASMVNNGITTYVNPLSADVWVGEEPTRRGAGQVNRVMEQNRSKFGSKLNAESAVYMHQGYRDEEFLRFRGPIRENGLISLRSRSEESGSYQIYDEHRLHTGVKPDFYRSLPGHKTAFSHPPTHIFIVHGPLEWKVDDYLALREERTGKRVLDDHESNYSYQLLVNDRYASDWLDQLYKDGCKPHSSTPPKIIRFDIYHTKEQLKGEMIAELEKILKESGRTI